jgi:hypothetical protein
MEKIVAALWAPAPEKTAFAAALRTAGATRIRLNLRDAAVAGGAGHVQRWQEPQAVAQFWLPSANPRFFRQAADVLAAASARFAAWLVAESTVIANTAHSPREGQRTRGWSQATFLAFRPDLDPAAADAHWRTHHTRVAVETQANFEYVQNRVVRALTPDAPAYDAFVEECFPAGALTDPQAFFDAIGDEARYQANLALMMESCGAFIDFTRIDVIPTSQYDFA